MSEKSKFGRLFRKSIEYCNVASEYRVTVAYVRTYHPEIFSSATFLLVLHFLSSPVYSSKSTGSYLS